MTDQSSDPFKYFRIEADELIDTLTRGCLSLEKGSFEESVVQELNRAAHTLKGAARLVELFDVGDAAHSLEDSFAQLQEPGAPPTVDEVTGLLRQVDKLQQLVANALAGGEGVRQSAEGTAAVKAAEGTPTPANEDLGRSSAATEAPSSTAHPTARPVAQEPPHARPTITVEQLTRVSTATLDGIGRCAGEMLELDSRVSGWREKLHTARRSIRSAAATLDKAKLSAERGAEARANGNRTNVRATDGATRGMDTTELRSAVEGVLGEIETGFEILGPLARRLHGLSLETKLVAVGDVAYRFEKTVRDVAAETLREVEYDLAGAHIQVDRLVLQALTEPICHLLRNTVAHGIELSTKREELGKPSKGSVRVRFEKTADVIRVVVEDDGAGLDVDRIREAAGGVGDVAASPTAKRDAGDISEFIFRPGLTTKKSASQVAGRGVGLDVVHDAVHRLHGTVKVESEPSRFCRFTIEVPSHLDVMGVFVLRVGGQDLLVPMARLVRTCVLTPETLTNHAGAEAILLDDRSVRLVSLGSIVDIASSTDGAERRNVVIVKVGRGLVALAVDSLEGRRRAVIKKLGPRLASCKVLVGAAVMSDGRPGFLLDTNVLGSLAKDSRFQVQHQAVAQSTKPGSVLVVDDSLTTRMLVKALLESAGYRVTLARDGSEALGLLAQAGYDLIIIDFEMPGLNGVEVAERIRETPGRSDIPTVMLTSLGDDDTKRKGLAAGMQAYLVKGQFDQTSFLDTIRGLIGKAEERE